MKKLLSGIISFAVMISVSVSAFAATGEISVKNNINGSEPVTYTYTEKSGQVVKSVKTLMTKLSDLSKEDSVIQTLTVTSKNADLPVLVKLRLEIPLESDTQTGPQEAVSTPSPDEYLALDYYDINVIDASGNKIYSDEDAMNDDSQNTYKDIPLGIMNESRNDENQIFNIEISVDDNAKSSVEKYANKLDWCIVTEAVNLSTAQPVQSIAPTTTPSVTVTAVPTLTPQPTEENAEVKEDKDGTVTLSKGKFLVGRDIDEGRYTMTGEGKVHVYTSEDVLKTSIVLKEKGSKDTGVEKYVINLQDGETIEVDNDTVLTPYEASKATSKPTSSPKVSSSSSSKATSKPSSTSEKSNPKTGDNMPVATLVSLSVIAIGAVIFIEIKKRKND